MKRAQRPFLSFGAARGRGLIAPPPAHPYAGREAPATPTLAVYGGRESSPTPTLPVHGEGVGTAGAREDGHSPRVRGGKGATSSTAPRWATPLLLVLSLLFAACSGGSSAAEKSSGDGTRTAATAVGTPAGSTAAGSTAAAAFPYTLRGTDGESLTLKEAPKRIVSLGPGTTETLFAIGAGNALVAVDRFSDFPAPTAALPKVDYSKPSVEALVGHKPDLVLATGRQKETVPAMRGVGLPVIVLEEPGSVEGVFEHIDRLGKATGRGVEAQQLITKLRERKDAVALKIKDVNSGPLFYHEVSSNFFTAGPTSFIGDVYGLLKARNIADGTSGPFPQLSQEVIVQKNPAVIVLSSGREGVTIEQAKSRPGWNDIQAVKTNRVVLLTPDEEDIISRPGPRVIDALERLAKVLYPEKF